MPARINIYNPEAIDAWLAAFTPADDNGPNLAAARLLPLALHNALAKEPSCLKPLDALPAAMLPAGWPRNGRRGNGISMNSGATRRWPIKSAISPTGSAARSPAMPHG